MSCWESTRDVRRWSGRNELQKGLTVLELGKKGAVSAGVGGKVKSGSSYGPNTELEEGKRFLGAGTHANVVGVDRTSLNGNNGDGGAVGQSGSSFPSLVLSVILREKKGNGQEEKWRR